MPDNEIALQFYCVGLGPLMIPPKGETVGRVV